MSEVQPTREDLIELLARRDRQMQSVIDFRKSAIETRRGHGESALKWVMAAGITACGGGIALLANSDRANAGTPWAMTWLSLAIFAFLIGGWLHGRAEQNESTHSELLLTELSIEGAKFPEEKAELDRLSNMQEGFATTLIVSAATLLFGGAMTAIWSS